MKNLKKKSTKRIGSLLILTLFSTIFITSCKKDKNMDFVKTELASQVTGTYTGTLQGDAKSQGTNATMTVIMQNDSLVTMHCITDGFDTTFVMQLYQNYDSIMMCNTGQDFYYEYGHNTNNYDFCSSQQTNWMNESWMNSNNSNSNNYNDQCRDGSSWQNDSTCWGNTSWAGDDQWNAWTNHMNTQHNQNDQHYGAFDSSTNSCYYQFEMNNDSTSYFMTFSGTKK